MDQTNKPKDAKTKKKRTSNSKGSRESDKLPIDKKPRSKVTGGNSKHSKKIKQTEETGSEASQMPGQLKREGKKSTLSKRGKLLSNIPDNELIDMLKVGITSENAATEKKETAGLPPTMSMRSELKQGKQKLRRKSRKASTEGRRSSEPTTSKGRVYSKSERRVTSPLPQMVLTAEAVVTRTFEESGLISSQTAETRKKGRRKKSATYKVKRMDSASPARKSRSPSTSKKAKATSRERKLVSKANIDKVPGERNASTSTRRASNSRKKESTAAESADSPSSSSSSVQKKVRSTRLPASDELSSLAEEVEAVARVSREIRKSGRKGSKPTEKRSKKTAKKEARRDSLEEPEEAKYANIVDRESVEEKLNEAITEKFTAVKRMQGSSNLLGQNEEIEQEILSLLTNNNWSSQGLRGSRASSKAEEATKSSLEDIREISESNITT